MRKFFTMLIIMLIILLFLPTIVHGANATATAGAPAYAVYAKASTGWNLRLIVDNSATSTPVTITSTCFGQKHETTTVGGKSNIINNFGNGICGPVIGVLNVGPTGARITSEARFLSGMLLNFETAADSLNAYGENLTVGGVEVNDSSSTFLLIVNESSRGGTVTINLDGTYERVPITGKNVNDPNSGWLFKKLTTKTANGVVTVTSGCVNQPGIGQGGCDASTAPGGPILVWSVVGPENGLSAPRVRALRSPST